MTTTPDDPTTALPGRPPVVELATSRPVPQWTRPGATPVETLGRHGHKH